jgi:hypothetical protein
MANLIIAESNWVMRFQPSGRAVRSVGSASSGAPAAGGMVSIGTSTLVHCESSKAPGGPAATGRPSMALAHPVATIDTTANDATMTPAPDLPTCGH